jgi:hypothetical protein
MKKIGLCLVSLILVVSFARIAVTGSDSSYDPMADVNRDGLVDVNDLQRLGHAYGSTGLAHQPGKTVISVWNETAPIENARVAIFRGGEIPDHIGYTDSDGIANFTLSPNTDYTVIAWNNADYNHASFTTNLSGEGSLSVFLESGRKNLPSDWVVVTVMNRTTNIPTVVPGNWISACIFTQAEIVPEGGDIEFRSPADYAWIPVGSMSSPICRTSMVYAYYWVGIEKPYPPFGMYYGNYYTILGFSASALDEDDTANVVIYI